MDILLRRSYLTIALPGNLAAAAGVASVKVDFPCYLTSAQLTVGGAGTGAGSTTITVNRNGAVIIPAAKLTIAGAAAQKYVTTGDLNPGGVPGGIRLNKGDVLSVDVSSAPATTPAANGQLTLHIVQSDI